MPAVSGIAAPAEPEATGVPFAVTVTVATIGFTVMEIIEDSEIRAALGTWGRRPFNQLPGRPIEGRSAHAGEGAERAGAFRSNIFP